MALSSTRRSRPVPLTVERAPLTPERIADAALALIDRDGLQAFSMRRLGAALGVEAMAIYHHHPSKGRLLDAVMDRLVLELEVPEPGSQPAIDRLRHALRSYRRLALRHPHAFPLLVGRRFNSPGAFVVYERILQALAECGCGPEQAASWFRTLGYFASGAGMADIASREQEPDATPLTLQRAPTTVRLPHVAAVAPYLVVDRLDAVFEFGLEVLLDALRRQTGAGGPLSGRRRSCAR